MEKSGSNPLISTSYPLGLVARKLLDLGAQTIAKIFGPQKGAGVDNISILDREGKAVIKSIRESTGIDIARPAMGGTAGRVTATFHCSRSSDNKLAQDVHIQ